MASEKRRNVDITKLRAKGFEVVIPNPASTTDFVVTIAGPAETPYQGGRWRVSVHLPPDYPYRSPSVGFVDRVYHPNVDERSGSVCLDVINQTWSPMFDLLNIFESFLPQLLRYANPASPLNAEAARLLEADPIAYERIVREHMARYGLIASTAATAAEPVDASPTSVADSDATMATEEGGIARGVKRGRGLAGAFSSHASSSSSTAAPSPSAPSSRSTGAARSVGITPLSHSRVQDEEEGAMSDASDLSDL